MGKKRSYRDSEGRREVVVLDEWLAGRVRLLCQRFKCTPRAAIQAAIVKAAAEAGDPMARKHVMTKLEARVGVEPLGAILGREWGRVE